MAGNDQVSSQEIASTLSSLGETTTAAELVRKQGQSKKLKVISEKKLMEWILSLLKQHMAGKADAFSDAEKEELLRKTQEELKRRMLREQAAEAERARVQSEYEAAVKVLNDAKSSQNDYEKAMEALRAKLENAEHTVEDLQQDNYDLQDQLQEKMALLSTTLAEKEKLRETVRQQMVHSGDLIGGVLGIDNQYYGGRHQEENPVSEEASQDEQFYHDFSTGAKVITTLMSDLERLRAIASQSLADKEAAERDPRKNLLESDLALLEQLKQGNLQAMDVAQPVATLVEALDGARAEAEAMEDAVASVTGNSSQKAAFTAVPDADGNASEVLAGAATVARELAAEIARSRQRVIALKQIADEAEQERSDLESQVVALKDGQEQLLGALKAKAEADRIAVPAAIGDANAAPAARTEAGLDVITQLQAGAPQAREAMAAQLALADRLTGSTTPAPQDPAELTERLKQSTRTLEQLVESQRAELESSVKRERALAEQIQSLAAAMSAQAPPGAANPELSRSSDRLKAVLSSTDRERQLEAASVAVSVVEALQRQAQEEAAAHQRELGALRERLDQALSLQGQLDAARRDLASAQELARTHQQAHRALATQVLKAAKGDAALADHGADLALAMEQGQDAQVAGETLAKQLHDAVTALAARKVELQREQEQLQAQIERLKGDAAHARAQQAKAFERERELAQSMVALGKQDPDLADATADLAVALEAHVEGEPVPADVRGHVSDAVAAIASRKRALAESNVQLTRELEQVRAQLGEMSERAGALESERDEMAESGKEIIGQLRQQKDARERELAELREENERAASKLAEFQERMNQAEAANRRLAEALAGIAGVEAKHEFQDAPSIEDSRMDLEVALSQLPSEEASEDVVTPSDIASQIAESGHKLAEALSARRQAAAAALDKAQQDQQRLLSQIERLSAEVAQTRTSLEERDAALKRNQNEVAAVRREMATQGAALAARIQELTQARSENATALADLETARGRISDIEAKLADARTQLSLAQQQAESHGSRADDLAGRLALAERTRTQLAQALRQLAQIGGANPNHPLAKASQKLEMAQQSSAEEVGPAGEALIEAARAHAQQLTQTVDSHRSAIEKAQTESARLQTELANQRAALVDREHALESARADLAQAMEARTQLEHQLKDAQEASSTNSLRLAELAERLRHAEAELEEYRAREGASTGALGDEVMQLRADLAKEHLSRTQLEAQLHDHRERSEAADARLKRQREEFTRRLEERDRLIQEKDRLLDEHASRKVDTKGLEAQLATLTQQLSAANDRIKELESVHGAHAGATSKSGDLARELKKAHAERDALRERQRQLESDLADAVSAHEELQTQLEEKRKEISGAREEMSKELGEERAKTNALKEEFRKLKEEVVGLRARLRRLTDDRH